MNGSGTTRVLTRLWFVVIAVVAIAVLYLAKILFLPLAFAVLFAFLLAPLVSQLERIHLPRQLSSLVVILGFATLLGFAGWALFSQLVDIVNDLPTYRSNIEQKISALHIPNNSAFGRAAQEVQRLGDQLGIGDSGTAQNARGTARKPLGATPDHPVQVKEVAHTSHRLDQLSGVLEPLTTAFLTAVFTFFVLLQREDLRNRIILLSGDRNISVITQAMDDAGRRISRYFRLQLLVNLVYASIIATALFFIGLPHPLLFGAIAGLCRFIPYLGPPIAGSLPTILALAVFPQWSKSLWVIGVFVVLEVVTANYAEPRIYGRHTGLSSLAILVAAAFWTLIWGPVGLLLSVPLTVCLVVMGRHLPSLEFMTVLLGDQPAIPPWTCFYQRLLAGDERQASEILEAFLEGKTLQEGFDAVLVPALMAAEQDKLQNELDGETLRSIRRATRELIEEAGFRDRETAGALEPHETASGTIKILCIPIRDETDELAGLMLARALNSEGMQATAAPVQRLDKMLQQTTDQAPDVLVLTGLPPVGIARSRRLYSSLRARNPRLRIVIGIWNYTEEPSEPARQISGSEEPKVFSSISSAVAEIRSFTGSASTVNPSTEQLSNQNAA